MNADAITLYLTEGEAFLIEAAIESRIEYCTRQSRNDDFKGCQDGWKREAAELRSVLQRVSRFTSKVLNARYEEESGEFVAGVAAKEPNKRQAGG